MGKRAARVKSQHAEFGARVNESLKISPAFSPSAPNADVPRASAAMRGLLVIVTAVAFVGLSGPAKAEWRMFIISSNADGYGVDRCLETGAKCGAAVASAYCKAQQFNTAASYRKVDRDEITGSIPVSTAGGCAGGKCNEFVAIVCSR
jgi:hypothetical protein